MAQGLRAFLRRGACLLVLLAGCGQPRSAPDASSAAEGDLALREALVARRESDVAAREALLAVREQALAQREEAVARRESVAGLPKEDREKLRVETVALRKLVEGTLQLHGLDLRDADSALLDQLERGDALMEQGDVRAAAVAYRTANAFALGTQVDQARVKRALQRATRAVQDADLPPAERNLKQQTLLGARGRLADGKLTEALQMIKAVEGPPAPPAKP